LSAWPGSRNARDFLKLHPEIAYSIDGEIRRLALTGHPFQPETPAVDAQIEAAENIGAPM
jgi:hypothetical protein